MDALLIFKATYLITALGSFIIAIFILFKNSKAKFNRIYTLLNLTIIIWAIGRFAILFPQDYSSALFWAQFLHIGSISVHVIFLHTILIFINRDKNRKVLLSFFYLNSLFILLLNFSDMLFGTSLFISGVSPKMIFPWVENAMGLYHLHLLNETIIPTWALAEMVIAYKKLPLVKRSQLKLVIASSIAGFIGGNTVVFLIYNIQILPIGAWLVPVNFFAMTYAITRYRLMDIRLVILRTMAFASVVGMATIIYVFFATLIGLFFQNFFGSNITANIFTGLIVGTLLAIGYGPIKAAVERTTNRYFYKLSYDPQQLISEVTKISTSIIDPQVLLRSMTEAFEGAFHQDKISFILFDKDKKLYPVYQEGFERKVLTDFLREKSKVLPKYFDESRDIFVIEELKTAFDNGEYIPKDESVLIKLYEEDVAIVTPLTANKKPIGFLVLGNKKNGELYTKQDIETLAIIADQSAVGIANAQLYEEQRQFGIKLEKTVEERTAELKVANKKLKELDQAKSEFISIASHQLRTPLTVIKGYISMILEGSFGKTSKVISDNLNKVYTSNERLIELVENLLDISRIESGRQEFNFTTLDMRHEVQVVFEELEQKGKTKGLEFTLDVPKEKLEIIGDSEKLHEVIMNFTDNAVKYTKEGFVHAILRRDGDNVIYEVKDSGIGMSTEDKKALFKKFSRAKGTSLVHTEGTGLGLYVGKMIIDTHKGQVGADSKGRGQGSTFWFSLPIKGQGPKEGKFKIERKEGSMASKPQ